MPKNLTLYTVKEKRPPLRKDLILWFVDDAGLICDWKELRLKVDIPTTKKEWDSIPKDQHKFLIWSDGYPLSDDDLWSYETLDLPLSKKDKKGKGKREKASKSEAVRVLKKVPHFCPHCSCKADTVYNSDPGDDGWKIGCNTPQCEGNIHYAYAFTNLADAETAFEYNCDEAQREAAM